MNGEYKHVEVTDLIIKAFYAIYNALGYGFSEKVYVKALVIEMMNLGLQVISEAPIHVFYQRQVTGEFFADLLVNNSVIVEVKSARKLIDEHEAQLLNYLKSTRYEVGLLLNFGPEPQIKRRAFDNDRKGSLAWIQSHEQTDKQ